MKNFTYIECKDFRNDAIETEAGVINATVLEDLDEVDSPVSVWQMDITTNKLTDVSELYANELLLKIVAKESSYAVIYTDLPDFVQNKASNVEYTLEQNQLDWDHFNKYGY